VGREKSLIFSYLNIREEINPRWLTEKNKRKNRKTTVPLPNGKEKRKREDYSISAEEKIIKEAAHKKKKAPFNIQKKEEGSPALKKGEEREYLARR